MLRRADLEGEWEDHPTRAIEKLHALARKRDERPRLFALAELCYLHAEDTGSRSHALGAAVYAYLFLAGEAEQPRADPFDSRFRVAVDIYNRGVAGAFLDRHGAFRPEASERKLPIGTLRIDAERASLVVGGMRFSRFQPADEFEVHGLRARTRTTGMGAPLVARAAESARARETRYRYFPPSVALPATAVLHVDGEFEDLRASRAIAARLELYSPTDTRSVDVRGVEVPLEIDHSVPLAVTLAESGFFDFDLGGFLWKDDTGFENGLLMLEPYQPGKVPVVFVHGTASSPAAWAETLNELRSDPVIAARCQIWLFLYGTGAPIALSAADLRAALEEAVTTLDPEHTDDALHDMVMIGHSQGGLLTRMAITSSGEHFWRGLSKVPLAELDLKPVTRDLLKRSHFFEPLPFVTRVVFVATPHRGSFLARGLLGWVTASLVTLPARSIELAEDIAKLSPFLNPDFDLDELPTSVDNMDPEHPFLAALAAAPMSDAVAKHSIIALIDGVDGVPDGSDGVVTYESAHLDGVSEEIVESFHSVQGHPRTIDVLRRILRNHLGR